MSVENKIKKVFKDSWKLFSNNFVTLILGTLIALVLMIFIITIPPLIFGIYYVCFKLIKGKKIKISDIFRGFDYFFRSWGLMLLFIIGVSFGFVLFIIPGFLLMILWQYAFAFSIMNNLGVMDSLKKSYYFAKKNFSFSIIFWILMILIGVFGRITYVGYLITIPFTTLTTCIAVKILSKRK